MSQTMAKKDRSFENFIASHQSNIEYFANRFNLEPAEVKSCAFIEWARVRSKYKLDHKSDASFGTYLLTVLENTLRKEYGGHLQTVEIHDGIVECSETIECEGGANEASEITVDGATFFEVASGGRSHLDSLLAVSENLETLISRSYADIAFKDVLRAHPIYTNPTYRGVIDGVLENTPSTIIAKQIGCTERRVRQAFGYIVQRLERKDPILDNRLVCLGENGSVEADPVRYRDIDSLVFEVPKDLDRARVIELAVSIIEVGNLLPVLIDQFNRVLKGVKLLTAAKLVGLTYIKTTIVPITEGSESRSQEAFERLRSAVHLESTTPLPLIPVLQTYMEEGAISEIVAARLACLPVSAQHAVLTKFGGLLIRLLTIREANRIVAAHATDSMLNEAGKIRETIANRLKAILEV